METLNVFIGTKLLDRHNGIYTLKIQKKSGSFVLPTMAVSKKEELDSYYIVLYALYDLVRAYKYNDERLKINYYANNGDLYYDWALNHNFEEIRYIELWKKINRELDDSNIILDIKNQEQLLNELSVMMMEVKHGECE